MECAVFRKGQNMFLLVYVFLYSNESLVERCLFFLLKRLLFAYEGRIGLSGKELLKYYETAIFVFVGNFVNKIRVVIV